LPNWLASLHFQIVKFPNCRIAFQISELPHYQIVVFLSCNIQPPAAMSFDLMLIITTVALLLVRLTTRTQWTKQRAYFLQQLVLIADEGERFSIQWYLEHLRSKIVKEDNRVGLLLLVTGGALVAAANDMDMKVDSLGLRLWMFAGVLVYAWWKYDKLRGRQSTIDVALQHDKRNPVLYLRSFVTDKDSPVDITNIGFNKGPNLNSFERQSIHYAQYVGPVIAIAAPGKAADEIAGAAKQHYGEDWQQHILRYMEQATLIIMRPYDREGVLWEFEQLVRHGYLGKTILYMHQGIKHHNENAAAIAGFRQKVLSRWNIDVGEINDQKPFVYFDAHHAAWETNCEFDVPVFRKVFYDQYLVHSETVAITTAT
jgi:hypothetical protein